MECREIRAQNLTSSSKETPTQGSIPSMLFQLSSLFHSSMTYVQTALAYRSPLSEVSRRHAGIPFDGLGGLGSSIKGV